MKNRHYVEATLKFGGKSLWSDEKKRDIRVHGIKVDAYIAKHGECRWGFLEVYFNEEDWSVEKDGLIYTDKEFLKEVKRYLRENFGMGRVMISYSEQGMQGDTYVHFDFNYRQAKKLAEMSSIEWQPSLV